MFLKRFSYEIIYIMMVVMIFFRYYKIILADKNVKLINLFVNSGKSEALNMLLKKLWKYYFTIDGDLQDDPKEIPNLINKIKSGSDMVTGWKKIEKILYQKNFIKNI